MPYSFVDMVLYFFIYSFCGWLMETVLCSVKARSFINRGFLNGPICPIYGCGILLMLIFLIPVRNNIAPLTIALPVIFLTGAALASTLEYSTSWAMEKLFHARWWDYSHIKFNVNGRICLSISLIWGALATGFLYLVQPGFEALLAILYTVSPLVPKITAFVLTVMLVFDIAVSVRIAKMIGNKLELLDKWANLIREHIESLELPNKEAVISKLEQAYEKFATYPARLRLKHTEEREVAAPEWRELPLEPLRRRLAEYAEELRKKRDSLMTGIRPLQRRMLQAFPNIKRPGASFSLNDLQQHLSAKQDNDEKQEKE